MNLNEENQAIKENISIKINFVDCLDEELKEYFRKRLIRPSQVKKEWMSESDEQKIIYHCIPVATASQTGWEILSPYELIINWNGGKSLKDLSIVDITSKSPEYKSIKKWSPSRIMASVESHFPVGILTFRLPFVIETPPGWGLWVAGPANTWIDGLAPIEAIVETNWLPFTFTFNWKVTAPNKNIKIPLHFPIGRIIPFPLNLNEKTNIVTQEMTSNDKLHKKFKEYASSRVEHIKNINKKQFKVQKFYKNGTDASGCPYKGFHKLFYKFKNIK